MTYGICGMYQACLRLFFGLLLVCFPLLIVSPTDAGQKGLAWDPPENAPASVEPTCPEGIASYWSFDGTGTPYEDVNGAEEATCVNCPRAVTGIAGGAAEFSGVDDKVDVPDNGTFDWDSSATFSVEYWMKSTSDCSSNEVIVGRDDPSTNLHWWVGVHRTNDDARFILRDKTGGSGGNDDWPSGGTDITDDQWHHIVAVKDTTHIRLYVDGIERDSAAKSYTGGFGGATDLNIGYLKLGSYYRYNGILDEVVVWNKALTPGQVEESYNRGLVGSGHCRLSDLRYRVFCRQEGQPYDFSQPAWEGKATTCTITGLKEDVTYYFVVRAVDESGVMSEISNEVPHMLTGLQIEGPGWIQEGSQGYYTATAQFKIGPDQAATGSVRWTIDSPFGIIDVERNEDLAEWLMVLSTSQVTFKQKMTLDAEFTFGQEKAFDKKDVWVVDAGNRDDNDADGMPNWWEAKYGLDPYVGDADLDLDGDGLSNGDEYRQGTNPTRVDTDLDGYTDQWEVAHGLNPVGLNSTGGLPVMETGTVEFDHAWKHVELSKTFSNPIVVGGPLSFDGYDASVARIRSSDRAGFDIRVQEWDYLDGSHTTEHCGYLVMEQGSHTLPDGARIEAGAFETDAAETFVDVSFESPFSEVPVVLVAVASYHEADTVTCRIRNVGMQGFQFRMQEQEGNVAQHAEERINYIAWEPSVGSVEGLSFEVGITEQGVTNAVHDLSFGQVFGTVPAFVAGTQTYNGSDTVNIRLKTIDRQGAALLLDEECSVDEETGHIAESVGYMVFCWQ